jgi:hypothetical protein
MTENFREYLIPYIISNLISLLCLYGAFKKPLLSRIFLAGFFLWAAGLNATLALTKPEVYLDYGRLTSIGIYKDFINGYFASHIPAFVSGIAFGQFLIFAGLVVNGGWTKMACVGGIVFGLSIAPLMTGSAFPATFIMALAFFILLKRYKHDYIWKIRQYQN